MIASRTQRMVGALCFAGVAGVFVLSLTAQGVRADTASVYDQFVPQLVEKVALPAAETLAARIEDLDGAIAAACAPNADNGARDAFHLAFSAAVDAQARIGVLRFGALAEESRLERLAFVPDRRNVVWRQVTRLLAKRPDDATDPNRLADKSVALQGLTALEWIAYAKDGTVRLAADADEGYACTYASALGVRLSALSDEIRDAFAQPSGQAAQLLAPGAENPVASDAQEAAGYAYLQLMTALSVITDQILAPVLIEGPAEARAARAPFQRSRLATRHLAASIDGLATALKEAGYTTASAETAWIDNTLAFENSNAQRALKGLPEDMVAVLNDPAARGKLTYVATLLNGLVPMFSVEIAGQLGFQGGFNALDGD